MFLHIFPPSYWREHRGLQFKSQLIVQLGVWLYDKHFNLPEQEVLQPGPLRLTFNSCNTCTVPCGPPSHSLLPRREHVSVRGLLVFWISQSIGETVPWFSGLLLHCDVIVLQLIEKATSAVIKGIELLPVGNYYCKKFGQELYKIISDFYWLFFISSFF